MDTRKHKTAIDLMEEDNLRIILARELATFVMEIVRENIRKGGDEQALRRDLEVAAYDAEYQWMAKQYFFMIKKYEQYLLDVAMPSAGVSTVPTQLTARSPAAVNMQTISIRTEEMRKLKQALLPRENYGGKQHGKK